MAGQFLIGAIQQSASGATENMVLPLESGDRLASPEFEWRYEGMPQVEGVVYMLSHPYVRVTAWLTAGVLAMLQEGLETEEHRAFVDEIS